MLPRIFRRFLPASAVNTYISTRGQQSAIRLAADAAGRSPRSPRPPAIAAFYACPMLRCSSSIFRATGVSPTLYAATG